MSQRAPDPAPDPRRWVEQLESALEAFDEAGGHRVLSHVFGQLDVEDALSLVVLPYLKGVGDRWASGKIGVAQEHFASNVLRSRLSLLMQGEGRATRGSAAPLAVLACVPGEQHEFGLMASALALYRLGWQVCYLGANTPTTELALACRTLRPTAVVLSALRPTAYAAHGPALRRIAESTTVLIGAAGASEEQAVLCNATFLDGDPVAAARRIDDELGPARGLPADEAPTAV
jgi:methanogenic corrinoid protein MtbC1